MRSIPVRWNLLGVVLIAIVVCGGTGLVRAVRAGGAGHNRTVFSAQLPNVPGKTLTAIVVEYGPGGCRSVCGPCRLAKSCSTHWATHNIAAVDDVCDVCLRHKADIRIVQNHVRFRG